MVPRLAHKAMKAAAKNFGMNRAWRAALVFLFVCLVMAFTAGDSFAYHPYPSLPMSWAPAVTLSPTTLTAGTYAVAYSKTVTGVGGFSPYTYSIASGSLPSGLSLASSTGAITGTPTSAGTSSFSIKATDSHGYMGSQAYSLTITASGGIASYTYAVTSGSLPAGLSLSSGGVLSGTPTATGTSSFTITATDSHSYTGSQAYSLTINFPPCAGYSYAGYCWYAAASFGVSCDTTCSSHGGNNSNGTINYVGSGGSLANCQAVANGLGYDGSFEVTTQTCTYGDGCVAGDIDLYDLIYLCTSPATTTAATGADFGSNVVRICSCNY